MPLQSFDHPLPRRPDRVLVAGTSGSGKTTLAGRLAEILGVPHVEIDALYHGPHWTPLPSFEADVREFASQPSWVSEWQYGQVRRLLADRADLVVWLDLPLRTVVRQVVRRSVGRRLRREILLNGNVEPPLRTTWNNDEHIVRWAWRTHARTAGRVAGLIARRPDLPVVRLTSHREQDRWLNGPLAIARHLSGRGTPGP